MYPSSRVSEHLPPVGQRFKPLEVVHILPHLLTKLDSCGELNALKEVALAIFNMFDYGAAYLIEGVEIDCPGNALMLTLKLYLDFGDSDIFFKPDGIVLYWYYTLSLTEERHIDPLSPRLLAIHYAVAYILHLSGAGDYIDYILRDADKYGIRHDGSTDLDRLVGLHLNNWAVVSR
uniref:Uncharacterized protein n=1 Tax=Gibberella zeae TaxID=5518 RepID=A0A4E9E9Q0_GIBZA